MMKTLLEVGLKIQEILTVAPEVSQVIAKVKNTINQRDSSPVGGVLQVRIINRIINPGCIITGDLKGMGSGEESSLRDMAQARTGITRPQGLTILAGQGGSTGHIRAAAHMKVTKAMIVTDSIKMKVSLRIGKEVMKRLKKQRNQRKKCR
ncbi:hypothetical protein HGM15179_004050 [Zosterops borbonicus]|uniref:Uncharacterized protein n=1 Tax=Zosterops borbonicus TaxID=364589 RepID=A0A8K1LR90_9PASS|nr:hypothetical protein HGM15179_004050 [Zosterops borbonicus]